MKVYLPPARRPRIEMVPLIDSFFLLLAFFMSSVLTMEVVRGLPVELPKAGGAKLPTENRLLITIAGNGTLEFEGELVTLEFLRDQLSSTPHHESLRVGIRADQATPYQKVVQVLAAVREGGVARVTLLTFPEKGKEVSR